MSQKTVIGMKIKQLRNDKQLTLKQLSDKTGLSTGFLSQLERGRSTIAIDSLTKVAEALDTSVSTFFNPAGEENGEIIVRSYEQAHTQFAPGIVQSILSKNVNDFSFLPRFYQLLPSEAQTGQEVVMYNHHGEEFIYVIEGVLTLKVGNREYVMHPGDSVQIHSEEDHNWTNRTSKITKFLAVNVPNPFLPDLSGGDSSRH